MPVSSFLKYLQYERRYSQHTCSAYQTDLMQFIHFIGSMYHVGDAASATPQHVRSWIVWLVQQGQSARSINRKLSTLRSYYRFLLREGQAQSDPTHNIAAPKLPQRLPLYVQQHQLKKLFDHAAWEENFSGLRSRLLLELLYATGIRRAELLLLTDDSIDWRRSQIRIFGKGNKTRLIPFGEVLRQQLTRYLEMRTRTFGRQDMPRLFVNNKGQPLSARTLHRIVHKYLSQVTTLSKKSPHILRHSFATHLLNNGADINAIKELLGHHSLAATQVYTHTSVEKLKETYRKAHPKA